MFLLKCSRTQTPSTDSLSAKVQWSWKLQMCARGVILLISLQRLCVSGCVCVGARERGVKGHPVINLLPGPDHCEWFYSQYNQSTSFTECRPLPINNTVSMLFDISTNEMYSAMWSNVRMYCTLLICVCLISNSWRKTIPKATLQTKFVGPYINIYQQKQAKSTVFVFFETEIETAEFLLCLLLCS